MICSNWIVYIAKTTHNTSYQIFEVKELNHNLKIIQLVEVREHQKSICFLRLLLFVAFKIDSKLESINSFLNYYLRKFVLKRLLHKYVKPKLMLTPNISSQSLKNIHLSLL